MRRLSNLISLTAQEKKVLKELIDDKFEKITTPSDYGSKEDYYESGVNGDIYSKTGKQVSGSTLERLVGLRVNENNRKVNIKTLEIVAEYLNFSSVETLLNYLSSRSKVKKEQLEKFELISFFRKNYLQITLGVDKIIALKFVAENKFEVVFSKNSILKEKDIISLMDLKIGNELTVEQVIRCEVKKAENLGGYSSGYENSVRSISIINKIDEQDELELK